MKTKPSMQEQFNDASELFPSLIGENFDRFAAEPVSGTWAIIVEPQPFGGDHSGQLVQLQVNRRPLLNHRLPGQRQALTGVADGYGMVECTG